MNMPNISSIFQRSHTQSCGNLNVEPKPEKKPGAINEFFNKLGHKFDLKTSSRTTSVESLAPCQKNTTLTRSKSLSALNSTPKESPEETGARRDAMRNKVLKNAYDALLYLPHPLLAATDPKEAEKDSKHRERCEKVIQIVTSGELGNPIAGTPIQTQEHNREDLEDLIHHNVLVEAVVTPLKEAVHERLLKKDAGYRDAMLNIDLLIAEQKTWDAKYRLSQTPKTLSDPESENLDKYQIKCSTRIEKANAAAAAKAAFLNT